MVKTAKKAPHHTTMTHMRHYTDKPGTASWAQPTNSPRCPRLTPAASPNNIPTDEQMENKSATALTDEA